MTLVGGSLKNIIRLWILWRETRSF